uniref:50S ribosomal protein L11 n=1 Tax=Nephromyces sp. ex Molgula occidentalis TaxID=2544991 RepID=A0A5C1H8B8_9APIC|nr:50S ribosomal protein L11 [Nephromyces sp. ex Molgula occidentalis]
MVRQSFMTIKLHLPAANLTPNSFLGSILGPHGINISNFCKEFNDRTQFYNNFIISSKVLIYKNKTYNLILKTPTTVSLILFFLKLKKGSSTPNTNIIGNLTYDILTKIIKIKVSDFPLLSINKIKKIICNTAQSIGVSYDKNILLIQN